MDYLSSGYVATGRWGHGPDDTFTMRWYRAAKGAKVYTDVHAFGTTCDDGCQDDDPSMIGEIPPRYRKNSPSAPPLYDGSTPAVVPDYLRWGAPHWVMDVPCAQGALSFAGDATVSFAPKPIRPPYSPTSPRKSGSGGGSGGGGPPSGTISISLANVASCGTSSGVSTPLLKGISHLLIACVGIDPFVSNPIQPAFVIPSFNGVPFNFVNVNSFGIDYTRPSIGFWRLQLGSASVDGVVSVVATPARGYYLIVTELLSLLPDTTTIEAGTGNSGSGTAPSMPASTFSPFPVNSYNEAFFLFDRPAGPWSWGGPYFSGDQDVNPGGACNLAMTEGYNIQSAAGPVPGVTLSGITPANWIGLSQNFLVL